MSIEWLNNPELSNPSAADFIQNIQTMLRTGIGVGAGAGQFNTFQTIYDGLIKRFRAKPWCNKLDKNKADNLYAVFITSCNPSMIEHKSSFNAKDFSNAILSMIGSPSAAARLAITKHQRKTLTYSDIATTLIKYMQHDQIIFFDKNVTEANALISPLKFGRLPQLVDLNFITQKVWTAGQNLGAKNKESFQYCTAFTLDHNITKRGTKLLIKSGAYFEICGSEYITLVRKVNDIDLIEKGMDPVSGFTKTPKIKMQKKVKVVKELTLKTGKKGGQVGGKKQVGENEAEVSNRTELMPGYNGNDTVKVFKTKCCDCWLCSYDIHLYLIFYKVGSVWRNSYYQCGEVEHVYAPGIGNIIGTLFPTQSVQHSAGGAAKYGFLCSHGICNQTKNQMSLADANGVLNMPAVDHFLWGSLNDAKKGGPGTSEVPGAGSLLYNILNNKYEMLSPDILYLKTKCGFMAGGVRVPVNKVPVNKVPERRSSRNKTPTTPKILTNLNQERRSSRNTTIPNKTPILTNLNQGRQSSSKTPTKPPMSVKQAKQAKQTKVIERIVRAKKGDTASAVPAVPDILIYNDPNVQPSQPSQPSQPGNKNGFITASKGKITEWLDKIFDYVKPESQILNVMNSKELLQIRCLVYGIKICKDLSCLKQKEGKKGGNIMWGGAGDLEIIEKRVLNELNLDTNEPNILDDDIECIDIVDNISSSSYNYFDDESPEVRVETVQNIDIDNNMSFEEVEDNFNYMDENGEIQSIPCYVAPADEFIFELDGHNYKTYDPKNNISFKLEVEFPNYDKDDINNVGLTDAVAAGAVHVPISSEQYIKEQFPKMEAQEETIYISFLDSKNFDAAEYYRQLLEEGRPDLADIFIRVGAHEVEQIKAQEETIYISFLDSKNFDAAEYYRQLLEEGRPDLADIFIRVGAHEVEQIKAQEEINYNELLVLGHGDVAEYYRQLLKKGRTEDARLLLQEEGQTVRTAAARVQAIVDDDNDMIVESRTKLVDQNGNVYYENGNGTYQDSKGEECFLDQNGNVYYKNGNGTYYDSNDEECFLNDDGNVFYSDRNGNVYYKIVDGTFRDSKGEECFLNDDGNVFYSDRNGNVYYNNGYGTFRDSNGKECFLDQNGKVYYKKQNKKQNKGLPYYVINTPNGQQFYNKASNGNLYNYFNDDKSKLFDSNDEECFLNDDGNVFYSDQNDNVYYKIVDGTFRDSKGEECFLDRNGNVYYRDRNGNVYYNNGYGTYQDSKGEECFLDRNGQVYYKDSNGQVYYKDSTGQVYYVDMGDKGDVYPAATSSFGATGKYDQYDQYDQYDVSNPENQLQLLQELEKLGSSEQLQLLQKLGDRGQLQLLLNFNSTLSDADETQLDLEQLMVQLNTNERRQLQQLLKLQKKGGNTKRRIIRKRNTKRKIIRKRNTKRKIIRKRNTKRMIIRKRNTKRRIIRKRNTKRRH
jgi:hypothetical protein